MRKLTYLAVFETDENPGFSVYFPDVCLLRFERALHMAKEALSLHVYGMTGSRTYRQGNRCRRHGVSIYPDMVKEQLDNRREKTTVTIPHWLKEAAKA
jgi:hypothetical protein